jgi:hypothetical protein
MELKDKIRDRQPERIPDVGFRLMSLIMDVLNFVRPSIYDERVRSFGIKEGMTVVDYGCGPGRYTMRFSKLVGDKGKVYVTKKKIRASGVWTIEEETDDHLKCKPK